MFIDSHCHINFPDLISDLDGVIQRMSDANVEKALCVSVSTTTLPEIIKITNSYLNIYGSAGVHPNEKEAQEPTLETLVNLSANEKIIAIGETGLDYYYTKETETKQKKSLLLHIEAAQRSNLPLIIHSRSADKDMSEILEGEYKNAEFSCVMHCFSSGRELAIKMLNLGFFLSMSGIVTFPKSNELRDIFSLAPIDQILVETDSPYLAPPPYRGKRNEPAYAALTAQKGAEIFDISYEQFARQIEKNFERLFTKAITQRPAA